MHWRIPFLFVSFIWMIIFSPKKKKKNIPLFKASHILRYKYNFTQYTQ